MHVNPGMPSERLETSYIMFYRIEHSEQERLKIFHNFLISLLRLIALTTCASIAPINILFKTSKKIPNLFSVLLNNLTKILAKNILIELGLGLYILKIRCLICAPDC